MKKMILSVRAMVCISAISAFACEGEHCEMLNGGILDIFEKYPQRFDSVSEKSGELDSFKKSIIVFAIEDGFLIPGFFLDLGDGSVAYWTKKGDSLSQIIFSLRGKCSATEVKMEAKRLGLKNPSLLSVNDILVF